MLLGAFLALAAVLGQVLSQTPPEFNQEAVDHLAESLHIHWKVITNVREIENFDATLTFTNAGSRSIEYGNWTLFFYCVYPMEPGRLIRGSSYEVPGQGLEVRLVNGMLYKMYPTANFTAMQPGDVRTLRFRMAYWSVSKTDSFPNWYVTGSQGTEPRIVASTAGTDPGFVAPFTTPPQEKRYDFDEYPSFSAQQRYERSYVPMGPEDDKMRLVPKPHNFSHNGGMVTLSSSWTIYDASPNGTNLSSEVQFLEEKLSQFSITRQTTSAEPSANAIILRVAPVSINDPDLLTSSDDVYSLHVDDGSSIVTVTGSGASGVFYALQSMLALLRSDGTLPAVTVFDAPRFSHRGLFLDISRNFRSRDEIERLVEVMAGYKLNRLHLHLADDEGWRIEINGLPELTQVGAKRCHDLEENECLLPQLGSGPFSNYSGSGYLSAADYRSILRKAVSRHVVIIPEIDMPGHSRAAIKAMEARYRNYTDPGDRTEAERYRLIEEDDPSVYTTPQFFNDNAINVCINSSYAFVTKVVSEIQKLHAGIQNLTLFHYGGDEVGKGAWVNSTYCQELLEDDPIANASLKQYFFMRVADITNNLGLSLGAWEDGLMLQGNEPFNRSLAENQEVLANVWDNVWEWGPAARTHNLANQGYKVVMSHGTHLYFDHPYEPDAEERGYYWATRFTDTKKTFSFIPLNYYANIAERRSGEKLTREEICGENDENCPPLEKPENIIGMQGQLWGETVRLQDHMDSQFFPRVLALAERAWHFAQWERDTNTTTRSRDMMEDWNSFARAVGYRELARLDSMGVKYRVPPPGAKVERQRLFVSSGFPGLDVEYSQDNGKTWTVADGTERITDNVPVWLRTRSADGQRYSRIVEMLPEAKPPPVSQATVNYIADNVKIHFEVLDNYLSNPAYYTAKITLNNTGQQPVTEGNWAIYFTNVLWIEPESLKEGRQHVLDEYKMALSHVMGYLFRLAPSRGFPTLESGQSRDIIFKAEAWSISRTDQFPNYYVAAEGSSPRVINNTATESLDFVAPFTKVNQWKRSPDDLFDPYTPSARYNLHSDVRNMDYAPRPYLPTPREYRMERSRSVSLRSGWVIVAPAQLSDVANFSRDMLRMEGVANMTVQQTTPSHRYVQLRLGTEGVPDSQHDGAYTLSISPQDETVVITGKTSTGVLYGAQSLLNMALQSSDGSTVMELSASDAPRYAYRGMHLDVSRNFHPKERVLKLLRVMGLYKLNVLHFHLGDDEGWRLEIDGLPELTTVGSTRCHDPSEERCLTPVMGSGPDPENTGTGYYTKQDYREILEEAAKRYIEVIPEFDMPGHSRAAIKAMQLRRRLKMEQGDMNGAHEFALDELGDQSLYWSIQFYDDNAVNPCLNSTFAFIRHVMQEVKAMHDGVNPLKTYHFGGDEVATGAWFKSEACQSYLEGEDDVVKKRIMNVFAVGVSNIAKELDLNVQAWEDGLMATPTEPLSPEELASDAYVNAWDNVWEWGAAGRPYAMANLGYKVIMGQATHLYFDHPYEPDPEERGFYWATRFTDTRKTFLFQPDHLWHNVGTNRMGKQLALSDICGKEKKLCPELERPENIVGMQGHLWSETVRTGEQLDSMIFPRLLALAERAWRRGEWEGQRAGGALQRMDDWRAFANTLGHTQLRVLDRLQVHYRVPVPGAKVSGNKVAVNTEFPGLTVEYSTDGGDTWQTVPSAGITTKEKTTVWLRTRSADGSRVSRAVSVKTGSTQSSDGSSVRSSRNAVVMAAMLILQAAFTVTWN